MSRRGPSPLEANRREFLTSTTVLLGSAPLASALASPVHTSSDETIKVALIGCGARGAGAAVQALSTKGPVKLCAMADAFEDRLESSLEVINRAISRDENLKLAERVDVPKERRFAGLGAYRKALDLDVDLVLLAEPPGFRPQHFERAIESGKHVFMEKPVATDAVGVRRVLAAGEKAKKKGLKVGVGLQRHHQPSYLEAIPRIHDGDLGEIHTLRCYWNGGNPAKTPSPKGDKSELEHQVRNWYFFDWLSGDHICEQHVHNLDVCNWIMQAHPVEAHGMGGRQVRTGKEYGNIFDHHAVEYAYADGARMFGQCRQIPGCMSRVMEFAHGSNGAAELGSVRASFKFPGEPTWRSARRAAGANPYQAEHDALFDAIRNNKDHYEYEYGALSTMTAILGRLATYSGKVVKWDEAFNSDVKLTTDAEEWSADAPVQPLGDGGYAIAKPGATDVV